MRLSALDDAAAREVIRTAVDAGVDWIDTADVYGPTAGDLGHNERLVANALHHEVGGPRISTKGGLVRPARGRWVPRGKAKHLRAAAKASLARLGRIDLYLLHAPDPEVKLATSARALQRLVDDGLVSRVGLCNVGVAQLREASDHMEVGAVQVELGADRDVPLLSGLVEHCRERDIPLMAHRPLGGEGKAPRWSRHAALKGLAADRDTSGQVLVLAWLMSLGVIPIVGAGRPETARALGEAKRFELDDEARRMMDAAFDRHGVGRRPMSQRRPPQTRGEVVLLMGIQGAGKSTRVRDYEARGYHRLNRDEAGGRLRGLVPKLEEGLATGQRHWVLDNTYGQRAERARVREAAWRQGAAVRCVVVDTPLAQAQVNVVERLLDRHGRLPDPEELKAWNKADPQAFGPTTQFRYERESEPPHEDEGFAGIERVPFVREPWPGTRAATIVQLRRLLEREPGQGDVFPPDGLRLGYAWDPRGEIAGAHRALEAAWGVPIEMVLCPHGGGPPRCWCRPPLPGLICTLVRAHDLDPRRCRLLGHSAADRRLADTFGMEFVSL